MLKCSLYWHIPSLQSFILRWRHQSVLPGCKGYKGCTQDDFSNFWTLLSYTTSGCPQPIGARFSFMIISRMLLTITCRVAQQFLCASKIGIFIHPYILFNSYICICFCPKYAFALGGSYPRMFKTFPSLLSQQHTHGNCIGNAIPSHV